MNNLVYRAVQGRVGIDLADFRRHGVTESLVRQFTERIGAEILKVDLLALARSLIGQAVYKRAVRLHEIPGRIDCSSFTQWVFALAGIELPRFSIQQAVCGQPVSVFELRPLDLVFSTGPSNWCLPSQDPGSDRIGHVGIVTNYDRRIIHATNGANVIEVCWGDFLGGRELRGARRLIKHRGRFRTIKIPPDWQDEIRTSDDVLYRSIYPVEV